MTIRVFQSTDFGAPQQRQGTDDERHLDIFDAVLVDGYGEQTITITQTGGLATITFPIGHTFDILFKRPNVKYFIAGADQPEYNGEQELTIVDSTHCTFPVDGATVTPATGVITGKVGGAGWTRPHPAITGKRSFLQGAGSSGFSLFLDNITAATNKTIAWMYESMSSTDVGVDKIGDTTTEGTMWTDAHTTPDPWIAIADETFVMVIWENQGGTYSKVALFGDINKANPADLYACVCFVDSSSSVNTVTEFAKLTNNIVTAPIPSQKIARGIDGLSKNVSTLKESLSSVQGLTMGITGYQYNTAFDPNLHVARIDIISDKTVRGYMKGAYGILHDNPFNKYDTFSGNGDLLGSDLLLIPLNTISTSPAPNAFLMTLTDNY